MQKLRNFIYVTSLVSKQRGSWKYQDAYAVATYGIKRTKDGRLVFKSMHHSRKLSLPQYNKLLNKADFEIGSMHHVPINGAIATMRKRLMECIGEEKTIRAEKLMRRLIPGIPE